MKFFFKGEGRGSIIRGRPRVSLKIDLPRAPSRGRGGIFVPITAASGLFFRMIN